MPWSLLLAGATAVGPAGADAVARQTMQLWCLQAGTWRGEIAIVDAAGRTTKAALTSVHGCSSDGRWHLVSETFAVPGRADDATAKVTYVPADRADQFVTAYFAHGGETQHRYRAVEAQARDPTHWTTTVESTDAGDVFEGKPATMRYIRAMDGTTLEARKEVRLTGETAFTVRSRILQRAVAPERGR